MSAVNPTRVIGGRYVVLGELGRGGMGVVWRAEDRVMGRHVAVKELHLPTVLPPAERQLFRERLLREARTAGRLNEPGIVTVYDVVTDSGVDHIVMELIDARTLAEVVATQGPLDERAATAVARALLAALGVAHASNVVHRDVKPSNVMLGPGDRVKLTDFVIAPAADDPRLTTTGSMVGSPAYIAPERLEGRDATAATDLWALGVTLFHAVQGTSPFARDTTAATISAVLDADVPPVRTRGALGTVITGLLQRSPQARLNGTQAAALLASPAAVQSEPAATTRSVTGRLSVVAPRRRPWAWVAAALVAGLAGGVAGGLALSRAGDPAVSTLTYGDGGDLLDFDILIPSCLAVRPAAGQQVDSGEQTDCPEPHRSEVFGILDVFGTAADISYPGVEQMSRFGASACRVLFDSGLVVPDGKGLLEVLAVVPSKANFERNANADSPGSTPAFSDRDLFCVLQVPEGSILTGSKLKPEPA